MLFRLKREVHYRTKIPASESNGCPFLDRVLQKWACLNDIPVGSKESQSAHGAVVAITARAVDLPVGLLEVHKCAFGFLWNKHCKKETNLF